MNKSAVVASVASLIETTPFFTCIGSRTATIPTCAVNGNSQMAGRTKRLRHYRAALLAKAGTGSTRFINATGNA